MKHFLFLIAGLAAFKCGFGQDILVPYKAGDKFGLSDKTGKIIVKPVYDDLKWSGDHYFVTAKDIILNDTLETSPYHFEIRKNERTTVSGVIYNGKEILKDEPYNILKVYPGKYILGKNDQRYYKYPKGQYAKLKHHERFVSLFTLKGVNVYPENFRRLENAGTLTLGADKTPRFVMFVADDFDNKLGLFVYDLQKQAIAQWLLKDVSKLKDEKTDDKKKTITLIYQDASYSLMKKVINYSSGKFVVTSNANINGGASDERYIEEISSGGFTGDRGPDMVAMVEDSKFEKPYRVDRFEIKNDSVFYATDQKRYIQTPGKVEIFTNAKYSSYQTQAVIYRSGNKFGLIMKDSVSTAIYDSLLYFGSGYIGGKKVSGQFKYGVLDAKGAITIPIEYDSIIGYPKQYEFLNTYKENSVVLKNHYYDSRYLAPLVKPASDKVVVYKNGKTGLLNVDNTVIIPVEYDVIATNNFSFSLPRQFKFIILKKDGKYGITELKLNNDTKQYEMENTLQPVFNNIPCFYYDDFYNVKGFRLFGLYDNTVKFLGYVNESGLLYYE